MTLSKSDYLLFLKHPAWGWLKKNNKSVLPPIDANTQAIFDAAKLFEEYAQELFPEGFLLGFNGFSEYESLGPRTAQAILAKHTTLFQAKFQHAELVCIVDILVLDGKKAELYEIKASTKVKDENLFDLAFQLHVLEKCGYTVVKTGVIFVNTNYVRSGAIDCHGLTCRQDTTEQVAAYRELTTRQIARALTCFRSPNCPDLSPKHARLRSFHDWLPIYFSLTKIPEGSLYGLCRLDAKLVGELEDKGVKLLSEISQEVPLNENQSRQLEAMRLGVPQINHVEINRFLDALQYPLYFFDYETCAHTLPLFEGTKPYQQVAFQYSLHVMQEPNGSLEHHEFLHQTTECPAEAVAKALKECIGTDGSVLVWYEAFEKTRNEELGELVPAYKDFFAEVNVRIIDLMQPLKDGHYVDSRFMGSCSIKKVLPVLVPELSYKELDVQEGLSAQRLWMEAIHGKGREKNNEALFSALLEYCRLDTLAMVRIYQYLCAV